MPAAWQDERLCVNFAVRSENMGGTMGRSRVGLAAVLGVGALLAGPMADGAAWAKKKSKIKCRINGAAFKTNARAGGAGGVYEPGTAMLVVASISRSSRPRT